MSNKIGTELQIGAYSAWTPAQQAALYAHHLARQAEQDIEAAEKEEKEKSKEKKGEKVRPERVEAGKLVDDLVSD